MRVLCNSYNEAVSKICYPCGGQVLTGTDTNIKKEFKTERLKFLVGSLGC